MVTASYVVLHDSLIDDISKLKTLCFMKSTKHKGSYLKQLSVYHSLKSFNIYLADIKGLGRESKCQWMSNGNSVGKQVFTPILIWDNFLYMCCFYWIINKAVLANGFSSKSSLKIQTET